MKRLGFELCRAGYCRHPEVVTLKNASIWPCEFPSLFGLITHPHEGLILFDTGYHPDYNVKKAWPESIYPLILPATIRPSETAAQQVLAKGYHPDDVKWIVISHFHGDHMAGLKDFSRARFLCLKSAFEGVRDKNSWRNLLNGYLPHLLPHDFLNRVSWIDDCQPWRETSVAHGPQHAHGLQLSFRTFDLFGDGALVAVDLPGHKLGQVGLILRSESLGTCFLVADAAWSFKAIAELRPPSAIVRFLVDDTKAYQRTLYELHQLSQRQPELVFIPSHCRESFQMLNGATI